MSSENVRYASEMNCCEKNCKEKAVAFFPVCDPDIPSHPYCRKCLDKIKMRWLIKLTEIQIKK
jgi:hypothetical protein